MAKRCEVCGKGPQFGNNVSHANNKTRKKWTANIQNVRIQVPGGGTKHVSVCTSCVRGGKVVKAPRVKSYTRTAAAG